MQEIDVVKIRKDAKFMIVKRSYNIIFYTIFYFIKSIYSIIKLATFGLVTIITSSISFPYTIQKCKTFTLFCQGKSVKFSSHFSFLKKPLYSLSKILFKFILQIVSYIFLLFFVVPAVIFNLSIIFLPYVIADNPNLSNLNALKLCQKLTKNRMGEIIELTLPFVGWFLLSIITLGMSSFFSYHYYQCSKSLYYLKLKKEYEKEEKLKTTLLYKT